MSFARIHGYRFLLNRLAPNTTPLLLPAGAVLVLEPRTFPASQLGSQLFFPSTVESRPCIFSIFSLVSRSISQFSHG